MSAPWEKYQTDQELSADRLVVLADRIADEEGVSRDLFRSVIKEESAWNPKAKSQKGAIGLAQVMPIAAKDVGMDPDRLHEEEYNLRTGAKYLKKMSDLHGGDIDLTLAAYNAGPGAVKKAGGIPSNSETPQYVAKVKGGMARREPDGAPWEKYQMQDEDTGVTEEKKPSSNEPFRDWLRNLPKIPSPVDIAIDAYKNPKKTGRTALQMLGSTAGGVVGSGASPVVGTVTGGALGYAGGNRVADLVYGPEEPRERTLGSEMAATGKDVGMGVLYELIGQGATFAGKTIGSIVDLKRAVSEAGGVRNLINLGVKGLVEKRAARTVSGAATRSGTSADQQITANTIQNEEVERNIPGFQFNTAQRGGDPNLLSLARQKGQQPGLGTAMAKDSEMAQNQSISDYVRNNITGTGNPDDFLKAMQQEKTLLAQTSGQARQTAEQAAQKTQGRSQKDIGIDLRNKAATARATSSSTAKRLYADVPDDIEIDSTPIHNKVKELFDNFDSFTQRLSATPTGPMRRVQGAMEPEPSGLLDMNGNPILPSSPEPMTIKQMKDFRSQMSTEQRNAYKSGNYELGQKLGQLKDSVNDAMELAAQKGGPEADAIAKLKTATDYWRDVHVPTFRQGSTGKILKTDSTGGNRVFDSSVGGEYFKSGKGSVEAVDSFKKTFGDSPDTKGLIRDYAAQSLLRSSRNPQTGQIESGRIAVWKAKHKEALDGYGLAKEFDSVTNLTKIAEDAQGREAAFNTSSLSKMLDEPADIAIPRIMSGPNKTKNLLDAASIAKKDKTGAAMDGLKASIGEYFQNNTTVTARDLAGNKLESLAKLDKFIKDTVPVLKASGIYTPKELFAFSNVHAAVKGIAAQQRPHAGYGGSATADLLNRATSSVLGRFGLVGQAASGLFTFATKGFKDQVDDAVARAMFDPRYADAIAGLAVNTKKMPGKEAADLFAKRIATLGAIAVSGDEDE